LLISLNLFTPTTAAPPGAHAHFRYRSNWEMGGDVPVDRERFRTTASDFQLGVQSARVQGVCDCEGSKL